MSKPRRPLLDRVLDRVTVDVRSGCWIFTGPLNENGYGVAGEGPRGGRTFRTHRVTYQAFIGEIPAGLHLDHLCRVRACCNPWHLDPVTLTENILRGARKTKITHCAHGHPFTPENTRFTARQRVCRTCEARRQRNYQQRRKEIAP